MGASLAGVLELNALFCVAGVALLGGLRGFSSLLELIELLGLALVLGLCAVTLLATLVLVAGGGLPTGTILGLVAIVSTVGAGLAIWRHRPLPLRLGRLPRPTPGNLVAAGSAVAAVTVLVALFRLARVTPIQGGDSWEFWVPKAQIIYFKGGIADPLFTALASPNYPLLVPALLAMAFRFMGSANGPELSVQYWILYAAFVAASGALLRRLAPPWLAWLFVASTTVLPWLDARVIDAEADWTLDLLFALAALLAVGWLRTHERWQLASFAIVLAAVVETKREGELLAACLGIGIAMSTLASWRRVWPSLIAVAVAVFALSVPWRLWWTSRHLQSDLPGGGLHLGQLFAHPSLIRPAFLDVVDPLFATQNWLVFVPIALVASAVCLTLKGDARSIALLYLTTFVLGVAGFTWVGWADPEGLVGTQNPMPRVVGSLALLSTVLAPLAIAPLLPHRASKRRTGARDTSAAPPTGAPR